VQRAVDQLMEHCDAVQILATWTDLDRLETVDCFKGNGNWYARQGMAHAFINRDRAQDIGQEIKANS